MKATTSEHFRRDLSAESRVKGGKFDPGAVPQGDIFFSENVKKFRRTGRSKAVGLCPFHLDHHPSLSLDLKRGLFYCFTCAEGGDVLTFIMRRDRVDFKGAAKLLNAWREELSPVERRDLAQRERAGEKQRTEQAVREEQERRERINARDHLHAVQALYDEAITEHNWDLMAEMLPRLQQCEEIYCRLSGLEHVG
jgi:hypothetical protein